MFPGTGSQNDKTYLALTKASSTKVEGLCFSGQIPKKKKLFHLASTETSSTKVEGLCFPRQVPKKIKLFHLASTKA